MSSSDEKQVSFIFGLTLLQLVIPKFYTQKVVESIKHKISSDENCRSKLFANIEKLKFNSNVLRLIKITITTDITLRLSSRQLLELISDDLSKLVDFPLPDTVNRGKIIKNSLYI